MIKIFRGEGVVDGEGGSSERCLKWGGGGEGSIRDLSKNISKQGWVKAKVVRRGRGFDGVTTPAPPPDNFNHTLAKIIASQKISADRNFWLVKVAGHGRKKLGQFGILGLKIA